MMRIVARPEPTGMYEKMLRLIAVVASIAASALVIAIMGYNPFTVLGNMVTGSLGTAYRIRETVNKAIPLAVLSLGTGVAFRMKFWNIGAEGQFYMGAFAAAAVAFGVPSLPAPVMLLCMFLAGAIVGGLWALIPAVLKNKTGASETLVTLMLNYVATAWIAFLQYGPWKDPKANGFPKFPQFVDAAVLPKVFGIHIGWIITIILAVLLFFLFKRTKLGYEIDVLGGSAATARYAGINVGRVTVIAIMLSGGICGIAGMLQASGIEHSLSEQLSGGLGFTAVITTWLAQLNPLAMLVVSFLFSMLIQGGMFMQSALKIPASMAQIIQGIIIFFVLGSEFFLHYRFVWSGKKQKAAAEKEGEAE